MLVRQESVQRGAQAAPEAYQPHSTLNPSKPARRHGLASLPPLLCEYKLIADQQLRSAEFKLLTKILVFEKGGLQGHNSLGFRGTQFEILSEFAVGEAFYTGRPPSLLNSNASQAST